MKSQIKVLLADDHAIVRMGIVSLLESEPDIAVVGQAEDGAEAVALARRLRPDVVVMDLMMPVMDGAEASAELRREQPESKVVLLTTFGTSDALAHAMEHGASGAVLKNSAENELADAIRKVAGGGTFVSREIRDQLKNSPPIPKLTPRQEEILASMVGGHTSKEIATCLGIGVNSVNEHIEAIIRKVGATNRTEAVAIALRKHLLKM